MKTLCITLFCLAIAATYALATENVVLHCPSASDVRSGSYDWYFSSIPGSDYNLSFVERYAGAELGDSSDSELTCLYEYRTSDGTAYTRIDTLLTVSSCKPYSGLWEHIYDRLSDQTLIVCQSSPPSDCKAICQNK